MKESEPLNKSWYLDQIHPKTRDNPSPSASIAQEHNTVQFLAGNAKKKGYLAITK